MRLVRARLQRLALPLRSPLATAHGTIAKRLGCIIKLEDADGKMSFGECFPLPGYGLESIEQATRALRETLPRLLGKPLDLEDALDTIERETFRTPAARAALDLALHDASAKFEGKRVAQQFATAPRSTIRVASLLTGSTLDELKREASALQRAGATTLKLKVGACALAEDIERVAAVRTAIGEEPRLRLDANAAWQPDEAGEAIAQFAPYAIEFIEQPCASLSPALKHAGIAIAADESLRDIATLIACSNAIDVAIVKPAAVGGLRQALRLAQAARKLELGVVITSFLDSSLGMAGAIAVAAALHDDTHAHGLATDGLLASDLASIAPVSKGHRPVPSGVGLGVTVAPEPQLIVGTPEEWVE